MFNLTFELRALNSILLVFLLIFLVSSCGSKSKAVPVDTVTPDKVYLISTIIIKCESDGFYNECVIRDVPSVVDSVKIRPSRVTSTKLCQPDDDFGLVNKYTVYVDNACSGFFEVTYTEGPYDKDEIIKNPTFQYSNQ